MHPDQLKELIVKYNAGTLGPEEKGLLDAWYLQLSRNEQLEIDEADMQRRLQMVWNQLETDSQVPYNAGQGQCGSGSRSRSRWFQPGRRRAWVPYAAAAAISLSVLSGTVYMYQRQAVKSEKLTNTADIAPGGNRAVLTLPDGNTILLDQAGEGQLADQGGARVIKVEKGVLAYEESDQQATVSYHTLTTPRGGQYKIILPDGTRVWLNASSTLRYPGRFAGAQRRVSLSGEGYFEVARGKTPFVVATAAMEAEVLGTHFNIKAYRQEENKTTLLEGSLLVTAVRGPPAPGRALAETLAETPTERLAETPAAVKDRPGNEVGKGRLLRPGQEAVLRSQGELMVREADIEMAVAWKNGLFKFRNDSLTTVMRQLARWYDVEVVYQGKVPDKVFTGEIYRNLNASQVLEVLGYTGLHFSIQGKKIIVKE